jgi:hypothetical protein
MATSHTFFATRDDFQSVLDWIANSGGKLYSGSLEPFDYSSELELVFNFPNLGSVVFWPKSIDLSDYPENSDRWRSAVITQHHQADRPGVPMIDADNSPVAGVTPPYFRDGRFWVSASVWFPTSNLRKRFPDLSRVCARFQSWLRKNTLVFDNTKPNIYSPYDHNLCMTGIVEKVYALPKAASILQAGGIMIHHMLSPRVYEDFVKSLRLRGIDV